MRSSVSFVQPLLWGFALAVGLVLELGTTPAQALPFAATLTITYLDPATSVSGGGSGSAVDAAAGAFSLPAGSISVSGSAEAPPADLPGYAGLSVNGSNAAGSFAAGTGSMALTGTLDHFLFGFAPGNEIPIPLDPVGAGGSEVFSTTLVNLGNLAASGTIYGNGWTIGAVSLPNFGGFGTLAASGFDHRATDGSGEMLLVSGFTVDLTVGTNSYTGLAGIAQLDLMFTPEPGTFGLLALGLIVLGVSRGPRQRS